MDLKLTNTLTGKKEIFQPLKTGEAGLYVCGVTPYDEPHLGHARCYVIFDVLRRVLEMRGLTVRHIQNFTDIDDKIIARARERKMKPADVAEENIRIYFDHMARLNIKPPDDYPRVTQSMPIIVDLIRKLVDRGLAYEAGGDVYFAVRKFSSYGKLSKRKIDELESGARVEPGEHKKDPLDFALWKKSKEGEPSWDSPWGPGRPGWHIECSAMSMDRLGETFDIHGGGQDLIFPHHENEIAQSNGATGLKDGFARVWVHNGFVTINKEKMSKSLGNFFTLRDILKRFDPMAVRYFLLSQHYRSPLNFSDQELSAAQTTWTNRIAAVGKIVAGWKAGGRVQDGEFQKAVLDDVNTPAALARLNEICSFIFEANKTGKGDQADLAGRFNFVMSVLGLEVREENWPPEILDLVRRRQEARDRKEFKQADELRTKLKEKGVLLEDTPSGPLLKKA